MPPERGPDAGRTDGVTGSAASAGSPTVPNAPGGDPSNRRVVICGAEGDAGDDGGAALRRKRRLEKEHRKNVLTSRRPHNI